MSNIFTVIVKTVEKGSLGSKAGLRIGDRIVAINETLVDSRSQAIMMLSTIETVTVEVLSAPFFVLEDDEVTSVIETTCSESDGGPLRPRNVRLVRAP